MKTKVFLPIVFSSVVFLVLLLVGVIQAKAEYENQASAEGQLNDVVSQGMPLYPADPVFVDVTISLYRNPILLDRDPYENIINYFADVVFEMSNGAHKIRNVYIYTNKNNRNTANIIWDGTAQNYNSYVSGYGHPGAHVYAADTLTYGILWFDMLSTDYLRRYAGYTLAHEWGHYYYGLFDEYQYPNKDYDEIKYMPHSDDVNVWGSIMNDSLKFQNFSTSNHTTYSGGEPNTAQLRMYRASGWETLIRPISLDPLNECFSVVFPRKYYPELRNVAPPAGQSASIEIGNVPTEVMRSDLRIIWDTPGILDKQDINPMLSGSTYQAFLYTFPEESIEYPEIAAVMAKVTDTYPIAKAGINASYTSPDGVKNSLLLLDDGSAPDHIANDGVYSGILPYSQNGTYTIDVSFDNHAGTGELTQKALMPGVGMNGEVYTDSPQLVAEDFNASATLNITVSGYQVDDHGNTFQTSTVINLDNTSIPGKIDYAGDSDVFQVVPNENGKVVARLYNLAQGIKPQVRFLHEDGTIVSGPYYVNVTGSGYFYQFVDVQQNQPLFIEISDQNNLASGGYYSLGVGSSLTGEFFPASYLPIINK